MSFAAGRQAALSVRRLLSTSGRARLIQEGGKKELPMVGVGQGNRQDPTFWTFDNEMKGERTHFYREDVTFGWEQNAWGRLAATIVVAYVAYATYNRGAMLIGGTMYVPDPAEFSDSELGIPADSDPDPEYWGEHQPQGYGAAA